MSSASSVNPFFLRTTLIRYDIGERDYSATGIFYEINNDSYLVTNKHVVRHEHEVSPKRLRILTRTEDDPTQTQPIYVPLFEDNETPPTNEGRWIAHPEADIAAVSLDRVENQEGEDMDFDIDNTANTMFSESNNVSKDTHLELAGGPAIFIGYPGIVGQGETVNPVVKSALISSEYGRNYGDKPCFVMDAASTEGMSGSPVLLNPSTQYSDSNGRLFRVGAEEPGIPIRLLGIHSGPLDRNNEMNLHYVWYSNTIEQLEP